MSTETALVLNDYEWDVVEFALTEYVRLRQDHVDRDGLRDLSRTIERRRIATAADLLKRIR